MRIFFFFLFLWRLANQFNDALPPPTGLECVNQEILELNLKKILLAKSVSQKLKQSDKCYWMFSLINIAL